MIGGGLYLDGAGGTVTVTDSLIAANDSNVGDGVMVADGDNRDTVTADAALGACRTQAIVASKVG